MACAVATVSLCALNQALWATWLCLYRLYDSPKEILVPHREQRWALRSLDNFSAETLIRSVFQVNDSNWAVRRLSAILAPRGPKRTSVRRKKFVEPADRVAGHYATLQGNLIKHLQAMDEVTNGLSLLHRRAAPELTARPT